MKKRFLLMAIFGLVLLLSACNGDAEDSGSTEEDSGETTETTEDTSEDVEENSEESGDETELSADELIDDAQAEWGETDSYELNQVYIIENGGEPDTVRTITTHSDQDELKVEINHNNATVTHYIVDDEHYIYSGDQLEPQPEAPGIEGTAYRDLIGQLDRYRSGEVSVTDEGYHLTVQIDDAEDASEMLSEEMSALLQESDDISGEINLTFDDEYRYTGGDLAAVLVSGGEEIDLSSNIGIENIDNIPVIEKPSGM